jgi:hypothetical protein
LTLLSAKTAGISGHNPTTQAESSTSTWYTFAGHVIPLQSQLIAGLIFGVWVTTIIENGKIGPPEVDSVAVSLFAKSR